MRHYILSLLILIGVYFLHEYGIGGAYVRIWWLDIVSHTAVSLGVALFFGALIYSFVPALRWKKTSIVILTFIIGFLWEWLEIQYQITGHELWSRPYVIDTIQDFIMDTIGAIIGAYIIMWRRKPAAEAPPTAAPVEIKTP